jgi:hypothetical protein
MKSSYCSAIQELLMLVYPSAVKKQMIRFYCSLNERDRRRYAAIEALKLGSRGVNYISQVLKCDQKTIKKGIVELQEENLTTDRQRKKGEVKNL